MTYIWELKIPIGADAFACPMPPLDVKENRARLGLLTSLGLKEILYGERSLPTIHSSHLLQA
jgi:hypothetical protein